MGQAYPDTAIKFIVGSMPDGTILMDFRLAKIDHLKLTREEALDLSEGLVQAVRDVNAGIATRDILDRFKG